MLTTQHIVCRNAPILPAYSLSIPAGPIAGEVINSDHEALTR